MAALISQAARAARPGSYLRHLSATFGSRPRSTPTNQGTTNRRAAVRRATELDLLSRRISR